jgi:hypothetical protein
MSDDTCPECGSDDPKVRFRVCAQGTCMANADRTNAADPAYSVEDAIADVRRLLHSPAPYDAREAQIADNLAAHLRSQQQEIERLLDMMDEKSAKPYIAAAEKAVEGGQNENRR